MAHEYTIEMDAAGIYDEDGLVVVQCECGWRAQEQRVCAVGDFQITEEEAVQMAILLHRLHQKEGDSDAGH